MERPLTLFETSVAELIAQEYVFDILKELQDAGACTITDRRTAERVLFQALTTTVVHTQKQIAGRSQGSMTFDEAMQLVTEHDCFVTRPSWGLLDAIAKHDFEKEPFFWSFDNFESKRSGEAALYEPSEEDRAATDWMVYRSPEAEWLDLHFDP